MKHFATRAFALLLCLCTLLALSVVGASAAGLGDDGADVTVVVIDPNDPDPVYSIDITFGAMVFTYTTAGEGVWDPETHTYVDVTEAYWSCPEGANLVTVENNSNAPVNVAARYTEAAGFEAVNGTFANGSFTLPSAVGKAVDAPELIGTAALTLSGSVDVNTEANTVIGQVTVSVSAVQ